MSFSLLELQYFILYLLHPEPLIWKTTPAMQVGLELVTKDYNMDMPHPFRKSDIISVVPIYKVMSYFYIKIDKKSCRNN
jgi:hypothetical protein